ncbi:hypothetical protein SAMN04488689_1163 [Paenibacillus sp. cl6col]|uniref:hypothetical protein n=1 Tax=Paenibacillus sp. cl6col TaxID=1761878 RepID=UPI00089011A6|nr:hypothetical protein [Paenibacillus sp. cl6col]SDG45695.1 hypothetical protein SAMN04488689_1163 [Paenibacillus sp. cl6col]
MEDNKVRFVTYTQNQNDIVMSGVAAINKYLSESSDDEKRSLLFCLDRYLDPYYGYNLSFVDEIIHLLQERMFLDSDKEIIEDILQLLTDYSKGQLDFLAEKIDGVDLEYQADALYALAMTYNIKYVPVFNKYEDHENSNVRGVAQEALRELSNI